MSTESEKEMIIEYSRKATCKDCIYCGYYYPLKKNGTQSRVCRHKCKLKNQDVLLSDYVCDSWKMGCSVPSNYDYIKVKK